MKFHILFNPKVLLLALCCILQVRPIASDKIWEYRYHIRSASKEVVANAINDMHSKMHRLLQPFSEAIPPKLAEAVGIGNMQKKPKVMGAINQYRAKICADMKDEHGLEFKSYEACDRFMTDKCHPGKDHKMDGDPKEHTSGHGHCKKFFAEEPKDEKQDEDSKEKPEGVVERIHSEMTKDTKDEIVPRILPGSDDKDGKSEAEKEADEAIHEVEEQEKEKSNAEDRKKTAGRSEDQNQHEVEEQAHRKLGSSVAPASSAKDAEDAASAPSPSVAGGPAPAPTPQALPKDERWYFKNGGTDPDRYHMDEKLKLPTQGYWGKLVEHEDGETSTGDWQKEFGYGYDPAIKICKKHPESSWCQDHYNSARSRLKRSSANTLTMGRAVFASALAFFLATGRQ